MADTAPSASPEENKRGAAEAPAEVAQEKGAPRESEPAASETPAVASIDLNKDALQTLEQRVAAEAKPSRVAYRSVLEQLRGFTGKSTPKALSELFTNQSLEGVRQEPAIALADGSSKVRVFVAPRSGASSIPKFSLSGASLVALTPEPDGSWMVEVLPAKGSYNATITMLQGGAETVIPLLVAPPMGAGEQGKLTESGFARFLADRGTEKAPRFDLNGDGRRDYLDDYIFTANYLVKKGSGENSGKSLPKKLPEAGRQ